ncbi:hypothetical protein LTR04_001124 [Oleoguttula sp. CCFEE 6159]|nr:hypothetical protein LTR04_001124 [Oleoguttula sp. CCFEE 6159]
MTSMSPPPQDRASPDPHGDPNPPTTAAFAPAAINHSPSLKQRSTVLVHQKSPLLVATPPQVTRALAHSHPFLVPLNRAAGRLSWTTEDPWESFLLVAAFWSITLYGDVVIRFAGPVILVTLLIVGMYSRRYSPLSSTGWTGEKAQKGHKRENSGSSVRHHKSLDEIVDTLKDFTSRCNILLDPLLRLTDFLSTQRTATSATTRPALTTLFIRILLVTPIWILLTLPPLRIVTTKRVILTFGTLFLSWHSRPARVSRTILWRSRTVRRLCTTLTGLNFGEPVAKIDGKPPPLPPRKAKTANEVAASLTAKRRPESSGVRFTFTLYENQRRWLGIGWTSSMLAYERAAWTDEHLNPAPTTELFELPDVEGGHARWRWTEGSKWLVEGAENEGQTLVDDSKGNTTGSNTGDGEWIYYDSKWRDGRRGQDGWGRYTRRRKWYRDAELVEVTSSTEITPSPTPQPAASSSNRPTLSEPASPTPPTLPPRDLPPDYSTATRDGADGGSNKAQKRGLFKKHNRASSEKSAVLSTGSRRSERSLEDDEDLHDVHTPMRLRERESEWGLGDDARMELG